MRSLNDHTPVTIRLARPLDAPLLRELAELDSSTVPAGELLVAVLDGAILAAVSLGDARAIADPFRPTADLVDLLRARARQLRRTAESPSARGLAIRRAGRLLRARAAR